MFGRSAGRGTAFAYTCHRTRCFKSGVARNTACRRQVLSPDLRSRRHPVKISAPLRLCVKRFLTQNAERRTLNSEVKNSLPITHAQSYPRVRQGLSHRDRRTEIVGQIRPFPRGIIGHDPTRGQRPGETGSYFDIRQTSGETGSYFDIRQTRVVKILECGDKNRAVRGSRHRFPSEPRAETLLVLTLSRIHLVVHT